MEVDRIIIQCVDCNNLNVATALNDEGQIAKALIALEAARHQSHELQVVTNFDFTIDPGSTKFYGDLVIQKGGFYIYPSTR